MRARRIEEPSASSSVPQLSTREWTFVTSQKGNDRKRSWRYRGLRKKQSLEEYRSRRECLTRKTGATGIEHIRFSVLSKGNVPFLALQNIEQFFFKWYLNNSKEIISEHYTVKKWRLRLEFSKTDTERQNGVRIESFAMLSLKWKFNFTTVIDIDARNNGKDSIDFARKICVKGNSARLSMSHIQVSDSL